MAIHSTHTQRCVKNTDVFDRCSKKKDIFPIHLHELCVTILAVQAPGGDVGDGGEGWSEGDECSVDGLGREVYSAVGGTYSGGYTPGGHTAYYDGTIPMYESYQVSSSNTLSLKTSIHPPLMSLEGI